MTAAEIRQSFIDFFKEKAHTVVPSESLMPSSPNLLFTNAGMNQFVPYFLGDRPAPYPRAVDTQKCIRAGGKHNDLEDVGFDTYHHTFFEMLGNWSFGDYFKKEAIEWAWELITQVWGFPKKRLYATVYKPEKGDPADFDQEAYGIWEKIFEKEGMDPKVHIVFGGKKDNFWMMGETGPCGPCSEIHMDLTEKGDTQGKLVNADSSYCIELWNLVFIQFNAEQDGSFKTLSQQHVDTGMGLERVAGVMATTNKFKDFSANPSNYNCDLFTDIFKKITELSGHEYTGSIPKDRDNLTKQELLDCAFRVLGDHIRTLSFSIADGILPGNEGRNYVLRRILRRAILFGRHLELPKGFFAHLIDLVVNKMGDFFEELKEHQKLIHKVIAHEEETFERTLDRGLHLLDKITEKSKKISGEDAFTLYDTYGFPIDLTQLIANERKLSLDIEGFNIEMEKQRERARAAQKKTVITVSDDDEDKTVTQFVGYDSKNLDGYVTTVTSVIENDGKHFLVFDKTPFYAEMGGQIGDTGDALIDGKKLEIVDTIQDDHGHFLHQVKGSPSKDLVGKEAMLSVSVKRRKSIQRNHTATHLLHWALRKVVGKHVKQAGSLVAPDRFRFDFSHFEALTPKQIREIEHLVNERILENTPVKWYEVPFDQKPENCIAFFGEKYGAVVRVVDIGDYSVELCGGTHTSATGNIGFFKITSEAAIASGVRRIEAITGEESIRQMLNLSDQVHKAALALNTSPEKLNESLNKLISKEAELQKELRKHQQKGAAAEGESLIKKAKEHDALKWIISEVSIANPNDMRGLAVNLSKELGPSVIILVSAAGEKATVLALASPEAIEKGYPAGNLVKELCTQLGGKGGGKPDYAMGGAKNPGNLTEVLSKFTPYLQKT